MRAERTAPVQLPLGLRLDPGATFESLQEGANRVAVSEVRAAAAAPAWIYLCGPRGTGKTHLLHAACHEAASHQRTACLVPLGQAHQWSVRALSGLQGVELVCFDELDAIAGDREWEEAVFNLLNGLRESTASVLMAAVERPAALRWRLPDLRSRLGWGTVRRLKPLDDEDKLAALKQRARLRGLELPDEVAGYLMRRVARDTKSLFRLLDRLDHESLAAKRRLTVPFVREVLDETGAAPCGSAPAATGTGQADS